MVKAILWTDTAKASLKIIIDFYKENVSVGVAQKIRKTIFEDVKILKPHEFTGAKEPLLSKLEI